MSHTQISVAHSPQYPTQHIVPNNQIASDTTPGVLDVLEEIPINLRPLPQIDSTSNSMRCSKTKGAFALVCVAAVAATAFVLVRDIVSKESSDSYNGGGREGPNAPPVDTSASGASEPPAGPPRPPWISPLPSPSPLPFAEMPPSWPSSSQPPTVGTFNFRAAKPGHQQTDLIAPFAEPH